MIDIIFRTFGEEYINKYQPPKEHLKVISAISNCQTEKMGSRLMICPSCRTTTIIHNSCRNRHCPKCQYKARAKWLEKREEELLPVKYFHVVFTVPHILNQIAYSNKKIFYKTLFQAVNKTINIFAQDPKWLGAQPGAIAILHTWGQNLSFHPHIHLVIPTGGIIKDTEEWLNTNSKFFAPVKAMANVFKAVFCKLLDKNFHVANTDYDKNLLSEAKRKKWIVFAQKPFEKPKYVIDYLGNYTHRIAISNYRIIKIENRKVYFWYKDYKQSGRKRIIKLDVIEFMRRFLQHVLPDNFYKIRYFGFMANRYRARNIQIAREAIYRNQGKDYDSNIFVKLLKKALEEYFEIKYPCPKCGKAMFPVEDYMLPQPDI